jgi:hypothetical protein
LSAAEEDPVPELVCGVTETRNVENVITVGQSSD